MGNRQYALVPSDDAETPGVAPQVVGAPTGADVVEGGSRSSTEKAPKSGTSARHDPPRTGTGRASDDVELPCVGDADVFRLGNHKDSHDDLYNGVQVEGNGEEACDLEEGDPDESTPSKTIKVLRAEEAGQVGKKMTRGDATANLVTAMIGASVLSLPHMVASCGWVIGPLLLASAGLVSCMGGLLIDQAMDATERIQGTRPRNIGEVVEVCFGPRGKAAVLTFTCFFQISKVGVYFVVIGANLHFLTGTVTTRHCAIMGAVLSLRLVFLRDITVISRWSVIGVVASVLYLLTISAGGVRAAVTLPAEARSGGLWPLNSSELPSIFAVMLYAYSPADLLPVLKNDMRDPTELPAALRRSHLAVATTYICLSAVGYFGWGRSVEGNVLESMCDHPGCPGTMAAAHLQPGAKWGVGYVLSCAVVSNLMVTIPIVLYCVFRVLESEHSYLLSSPIANSTMRVATVLAAVSIALFVPFFIEILQVIASALLVSLQIFLPVAVTFVLSRSGAVKCGAAEAVLLALGLCIFTVGETNALRNLAAAISRSSAA